MRHKESVMWKGFQCAILEDGMITWQEVAAPLGDWRLLPVLLIAGWAALQLL
jgi:hypothetical protein